MIKRRYFRQDHGDKSDGSSSSSSSGSDSDREPAVSDEEVSSEEQEQQGALAGGEESGEEDEGLGELEPPVQEESSGYQSEDSSGNDVDGPSADDANHVSPREEEHHEIGLPAKKASCGNAGSDKGTADKDDAVVADFDNNILKCKSVYKCKLCPRIMCLNEEMVMMHLKSKRHARSKKLLGEGRLKMMLNSDGELEEEAETHAERHARTVALAQQVQKTKKDSGRQRQNRRRKKRSTDRKEKKQETPKSDTKRRKTKG